MIELYFKGGAVLGEFELSVLRTIDVIASTQRMGTKWQESRFDCPYTRRLHRAQLVEKGGL